MQCLQDIPPAQRSQAEIESSDSQSLQAQDSGAPLARDFRLASVR